MKTTLLSALAFGAITTLALTQPATSMDTRSGPVMLTSVQMDKVKAGALRDAQKRQAKANKVPFGQCKTGPGTSQCH
jgi:hypothetical protein